MPSERDQFGQQGEKIAERVLRDAGMRILERRFRIQGGELDLIALDLDTLVFVEVKTQTGDQLLDPEDRITRGKQERMAFAARYYVVRKKLEGVPCRFDAVAVIFDSAGTPRTRHTREAFLPARW